MATLLHYGSRGRRVSALQHLLNHNAYFDPRHRLAEDGQMGTLTCAAVQQAKYRLGYERQEILPIAGERVFGLLRKTIPLPDAFKVRRKRRLAAIAEAAEVRSRQTRLRLKALAKIKGELGTIEAGGHSNVIKYNNWWGWGAVAYCVIGIAWAWVMSGSEAFVKGSRWANTDAMLADAQAGRNGLHLTNDPDPGCPGVIDFDGHSDPDHGITFVRDNGDGTCETIEFNTTGNGGMEGVWRKDRPLRNCWWFGVEN